MKKFLLTLSIIVLNLAFTPALAQVDLGTGAGGLANQIGNQAGYSPNSVNDYTLSETIGRIIKVALSFVGTIFFVLSVYAGFLWMTAQGNDEKVSKATGIFRTGIIGMIIVVAAYSITYFVMIYAANTTAMSGR